MTEHELDTLLRDYGGAVRSVCRAILPGHPQDAEEAEADTFYKLWRGAHLPADETHRRRLVAKEFQVRCMAQYLRGNGPTSIFASAGLDPKIMGGKRIERAIARWKADPKIMLEAQTLANKSDSGQRDLLVITQAMTIKWLEKKVMDLQKQLHLLESHAMNCSLPNSNSREGLVSMA